MQQANQNIYDKLISVFKSKKFHTDVNGDVFIEKVIDDIVHQKPELIEIILSDEVLKKAFFQEIEGTLVFKPKELIEALSAENKFLQSKTTYSQSIGLIKKDDFIVSHDDVVLAFPFKDTVFAGGQEKEDEKSKENFLHGIINANETSRLLEPKAMTNIKRYSKDGIEKNPTITDKDNLIIKGNNLLALHSLLDKADGTPLYRGKVKLIYIDPPYNTGNDGFKYNDNFSHSTWLTFMKNRLEAAREFLRDDGVIFVQCDDNEQAYLKVLMDEIFGRKNFVTSFVWNKKNVVQNDAKFASNNHEYILCYRYSEALQGFNLLARTDEMNARYSNPDNDPRGNWTSVALQAKSGSASNIYEIKFPNGITWKPVEGTYPRLSKDSLQKAYNEGRLWFGKEGKNIPRLKKYLSEVKQGIIANSLWMNEDVGSTQLAKENLKKLLGQNMFTTPKPEQLIKRIIELSTQPSDLVMDYHLGSGTTAAVAHKMGRQYIGIEQMDYIEDVTVERLKKVIDGEQGGISKSVEWQGGGEFVYMELKKIDDFQNIAQNDDEKLNAIKMKLATEMYYLPYSEIEDATYKIPSKEKEVNYRFYGGDDE
ncbi:MAG: site-specific DNA-methyltransferase [Sulfurovum sp.]|nr:site-specific DNA-methyltransferase [Sulfurovum sp.]MDD3602631.1 site-specific DNA-methyltransferase [Sulfurovum sp.]